LPYGVLRKRIRYVTDKKLRRPKPVPTISTRTIAPITAAPHLCSLATVAMAELPEECRSISDHPERYPRGLALRLVRQLPIRHLQMRPESPDRRRDRHAKILDFGLSFTKQRPSNARRHRSSLLVLLFRGDRNWSRADEWPNATPSAFGHHENFRSEGILPGQHS